MFLLLKDHYPTRVLLQLRPPSLLLPSSLLCPHPQMINLAYTAVHRTMEHLSRGSAVSEFEV